MPIYLLDEHDKRFPNPNYATEEGIIGAGGDLSPERLVNAYCTGIFPWYSEGEPILWWSPNPRGVLFLEDFKLSKSMRKFLRKKIFKVTFDKEFERIISLCGDTRREKEGTWITEEMIESYTKLHYMGIAHSVEVWRNDDLVGGLYGVSLGKVFFGESMFSKESNASKTALNSLVEFLKKNKFEFIDCQMYTRHLGTMGAKNIPRKEFLDMLRQSLAHNTLKGNWGGKL